jgi:PPOX class probable F420-dependent enzyme
MNIEQAQEFLRTHHHAVMSTIRRDGRPQLSPVTVVVDDGGRVMISSRETAIKVRNLRRDPRIALALLNDAFFGEWGQVEGTAEIVPLPGAMDLLVDYYRRASGEHPDWDDYRAAMERDKRVIVRFAIDRAGPTIEG